MFQKRTSPILPASLVGTEVSIGDKTPFEGMIVPIKRQIKQAKPCGTCDHNRRQPRFYEPPTHHKKRPGIVDQIIAALKKTYKRAKLLAKLFYRKQKIHSQRREAIIRVLQVMIYYMDLETFEVGFFNDAGDFIRLDIAKIASYASISLIRAKRAISDITRAGYLTTIRQYKEANDGRKIGMTAIRTISKSLFRDLNIDHLSIFKASEWKRKRNEKKLAKKNKERLRMLIESVNSIAKKNSNKVFTPIRKAYVLLEQVTKEVIASIKEVERQNE